MCGRRDPAKAARELQAAEASGTSEDIMDGSGSRPLGPNAASSAAADNSIKITKISAPVQDHRQAGRL